MLIESDNFKRLLEAVFTTSFQVKAELPDDATRQGGEATLAFPSF